jgi:hypothetical protein
MNAWKTAKSAKPCTIFPAVWAAIVGCTGTGKSYRYAPAHFGVSRPEYACPVCRAAKDASDALMGPAHQEHLTALQAAAGVADYRVAEVEWIDGRPVLTGKVDKGLAHESADYALREMSADVDSVARAARALVVYHGAGGDCRGLVASHRVAPRQLAALRNAFRVWTRESSPTGRAASL